MDGLAEGYQPAIDTIWDRLAKNGLFGPKSEFLGQNQSFWAEIRVFGPKKKGTSYWDTMFQPRPGKVVQIRK